MVLSIIDLGSNSIRMDIVDINEDTGSHHYIERCRELVKLSEGMNTDGCIQPDAANRTIDALRGFNSIMRIHNTSDCMAVATAAVRKAVNRDEFCKNVLDETGISINIIPGEQEAEYDFMGVMSTLDINDCIIVDTGGGSTELILASDGEALARTSIPVGAVNMTEQFLSCGETPEALSALSDYISSQLDKIHWIEDAYKMPIVGLGGSIYNLASVCKNISGADRNALHGTALDNESVIETFNRIAEMTPAERLDAGIEAGRTDTILCGIMPVTELINKISSDMVIISSAGLKEGILTEFMESIGFKH